MSNVGATSGSSNTSGTNSSSSDFKNKSLNDLDMDDFLSLLLTELQQQDPLSPMETSDMINQISQIRDIASNTQLTKTLESVGLGESISTASSLIGQTITGLTAAGDKVEGTVDSVTISNGSPVVNVEDSSVPLANITAVKPTTSSS